MSWLRESPSYFRFYNGTIRLDEPPEGRVSGQKLNIDTGLFEPASFDEISSVLGARDDYDLSMLSEENFVKETEVARSYYLRGEGPVFDIYDSIQKIFDRSKAEGRRISSEEADEVYSLWHQSFRLWEEESARLAAGEDPSFHYAVIGGV
ncbi:hypothetical protein ABIA39_003958 [Nocardia sp. GAS34]|uniref:hypothetical protein n=1 Tax=unclassified Nocardia TaxID=2637762 RepID=UPI003D19705F